jgi:hypothetical protein
MAWRSRYFEGHSFKRLFKDYFAQGARWTATPRPELSDQLFDYKWSPPQRGEPLRNMITEFEPVFDAADFIRCGRDLFGIRSNVTNAAVSNGCAAISPATGIAFMNFSTSVAPRCTSTRPSSRWRPARSW